MQKQILKVLSILLIGCSGVAAMSLKDKGFAAEGTDMSVIFEEDAPEEEVNEALDLYNRLELESYVGFEAFEQAYLGYSKIDDRAKDVLTLIDFSKPSAEERFFVIDMDEEKVLYKSLVAHGKNSGMDYATSFSNVTGSYKSSMGFFITENTYYGRNGYSLVLDGLEEGINHNAKSRAIVVHGSSYVNTSMAKSSGRVGRSLGCPALPRAISKQIIDVIKGGSVMFIYAGDNEYPTNSPILAQMLG